MTDTADTVAVIRRFNRFYTPAIGVLDRGHLGLRYTLAENRVVYEVAQASDATPKAISEATKLDPGYLSRILKRLERDGLVARRPSPEDGRSVRLRLTAEGQALFDELQRRTVARVEGLIQPLGEAERRRLAEALTEAQALLEARPAQEIALRPHAPGDMGWVVERHAVLYGREYGWTRMEAMVARITADFLDSFDEAAERCWIAARGSRRLGSIFLVRDAAPQTARIRLLLLEPQARGLGLGRRLVDEAVAFARAAGYREVVLWTHQVLTAARAIYASAGFTLEETWTHDEFGVEEVSETWRLRF